MKIAYGTYAMPKHMLEDRHPDPGEHRLRRRRNLRRAAPRRFAAGRHDLEQTRGHPELAGRSRHGRCRPHSPRPFTCMRPKPAKHAENFEVARALNGLARDFVPDREPVLAFGIGGRDLRMAQ